MGDQRTKRICVVTEELSYGKGTGGIGGAFHELALALRRVGHVVDILFVPDGEPEPLSAAATDYYSAHGIRLIDPSIATYVWAPYTYEKRSYAIFRYLIALEQAYDFVHFHDYRGLGFATMAAKSQGLGFARTTFVVQTHGPTRWAMEANDYPLVHEDQLKIDYMERESIARADLLVSPSAYLLRWFEDHGWSLPPNAQRHIIQNICSHLVDVLGHQTKRSTSGPANEIIFFARHEERKGIRHFCDVLDALRGPLRAADILVTFLGAFGSINGEPSALYLARRARHWKFRLRLLPDCDRIAAGRYLRANDRSVVIVASRFENSPYSVVEAAIAGKPLICSNGGGASELLETRLIPVLTCEMDRHGLAEKLTEAIQTGLPPAQLAIGPAITAQKWVDLHAVRPTACPRMTRKVAPRSRPTVTAAITHFERPAKLYDALMSLGGQTYTNMEIIIIDDGSAEEATLLALDRLAPLLSRLNARLIRQQNLYLGAARNRAVAESKSDFLLFLDDDDIALPTLISTLVNAAEATGADIVNCLYLYMAEARRFEAHPYPESFQEKVSHVVTGGPLAAAPFDNVFGGATALIRRNAIERLGGYSETYGVGFEDFEFYTRAAQAGMKIEVCPLPLLLYETGKSSMVSATSRLRNWNRVVKAIDLSKQACVWNDLVSVVAGTRAQDHNANFNRWWMSSHPQADLLAQIQAETTDTPQYAALVMEFATAETASSFADALRVLATERASRSEPPSPLLMPPMSPHPLQAIEPHAELDALLLSALIDLSADRTDDAIDGFLKAWTRDPDQQITPGHIRFLQVLVRGKELSSEHAIRVLKALELKALELKDLETLIPVTFRLALAAHDAGTAMRTFEQANIVDETNYLSCNPLAKTAIAEGSACSALDHWTRTKDGHGQAAFPLLRKLRQALQAELGVEVPISSFRQYIGMLAQGGREHRPRPPALAVTATAPSETRNTRALNGHASGQAPATPKRYRAANTGA